MGIGDYANYFFFKENLNGITFGRNETLREEILRCEDEFVLQVMGFIDRAPGN